MRFVLSCFCAILYVLCVLEVVSMWSVTGFLCVMFVFVENDVCEDGVCSVQDVHRSYISYLFFKIHILSYFLFSTRCFKMPGITIKVCVLLVQL